MAAKLICNRERGYKRKITAWRLNKRVSAQLRKAALQEWQNRKFAGEQNPQICVFGRTIDPKKINRWRQIEGANTQKPVSPGNTRGSNFQHLSFGDLTETDDHLQGPELGRLANRAVVSVGICPTLPTMYLGVVSGVPSDRTVRPVSGRIRRKSSDVRHGAGGEPPCRVSNFQARRPSISLENPDNDGDSINELTTCSEVVSLEDNRFGNFFMAVPEQTFANAVVTSEQCTTHLGDGRTVTRSPLPNNANHNSSTQACRTIRHESCNPSQTPPDTPNIDNSAAQSDGIDDLLQEWTSRCQLAATVNDPEFRDHLIKEASSKFERIAATHYAGMLAAFVTLSAYAVGSCLPDAMEGILEHASLICARLYGLEHAITVTVKWMTYQLVSKGGAFRLSSWELGQICNEIKALPDEERSSTFHLTSLYNLAIILGQEGHATKAIPLLRELVLGCAKAFGTGHVHTVMVKMTLSRMLLDNEEFEAAECLMDNAISGVIDAFGDPEDPYILECFRRQALLFKRSGRHEKVEPILRHVLHGRIKRLGPDHPYTKGSIRELQRWLNAQRRTYELAALRDQIAIWVRDTGKIVPLPQTFVPTSGAGAKTSV